MDKLKQSIDQKEAENKQEFEKFLQKNKDNDYLTNMKLLRFKFYNYKELLKVFLINFQDERFQRSKRSTYLLFSAPSITLVLFTILAPFSIFK